MCYNKKLAYRNSFYKFFLIKYFRGVFRVEEGDFNIKFCPPTLHQPLFTFVELLALKLVTQMIGLKHSLFCYKFQQTFTDVEKLNNIIFIMICKFSL